jgi:acyl-coenzyme A synthetase/AMP-(fatty) acid ligase
MMAAQPQSHVGFIGYSAYAILAGIPLIALYDANGAELAAAVSRYRPTMVMAFAHSYGELAALELPAGTLDSTVGWVTMGDAVHEAHMRQILGARSKELPSPAAFYDRFGSTELGWGLMVRQRTLSSPRQDRCIGQPDPVAQAAVLKPDGSVAGVQEIGLLGVRSPTLTAGYWSDSDTSYRSRLAGYWLTGDVVFQDSDGLFYHVDRLVDVIETDAGPGYSVQMEELLLNDLPEIQDCAVVAGRFEDRTVAVAVVKPRSADAAPDTLLTAVNRVLRKAGHPEVFLLDRVMSADDLPMGVTGKVLKRQLRDRYARLAAYLVERDPRWCAVAGADSPA